MKSHSKIYKQQKAKLSAGSLKVVVLGKIQETTHSTWRQVSVFVHVHQPEILPEPPHLQHPQGGVWKLEMEKMELLTHWKWSSSISWSVFRVCVIQHLLLHIKASDFFYLYYTFYNSCVILASVVALLVTMNSFYPEDRPWWLCWCLWVL